MAAIIPLSLKTFERARSKKIVHRTWKGYKNAFLSPDGRVRRPTGDGQDDTVSEGQAYAMLRAAWLGDKEAFDSCYRWSEANLRRRGDFLLSWNWKNGIVTDAMPAADADIDYALSLFLAESRWPSGAPDGLTPYGKRAGQSAADILGLLTYRAGGNRLYLSPWILPRSAKPPFPVNPSYYSPAHFRIFHQMTGDPRWLELAETGYRILGDLAKEFGGRRGVGLFPDWCSVDAKGRLRALAKKNAGFGWEAVRIPVRIGLDHVWFGRAEAAAVLAPFAGFIAGEWAQNGSVSCEYGYDGKVEDKFENPAFYAAYYWALTASDFPLARKMLAKTRDFPHPGDGRLYGAGYYVNSLAWLGDGLASGMLKKPVPAR